MSLKPHLLLFIILLSLSFAGHSNLPGVSGLYACVFDQITLTHATAPYQVDEVPEVYFVYNFTPIKFSHIQTFFPRSNPAEDQFDELSPLSTRMWGDSIDERTFIACSKSTKAKPRAGRPVSSNDKFNVILSEPANCTGGKDTLGICALHSQNFTGNGITIAILDYQYYMDRLSERELPRKRIEIFDGPFSEDERHGTACAEIIGDVAPNATLYMVGLSDVSEDGFVEAIDKLQNLDRKIDIVSCSVDSYSGLFEGQDSICRAVRNLTRNGTIWVNAAGGSALQHWNGTFRDKDGNGFNEFAPDDETLNLVLKRGMSLRVWLSWNDSWTRSLQDYDLYLLAPDGTNVLSSNPQKGYEGQKPLEAISLIAPVSGNYSIKIKKYNASKENMEFQLFASQNLSEYNFENSSLGVLASCPEVITVGAVDASTLQLENYSSRGPTIGGRLKPELVAPDNVTTASYMPDKFRGSSASAPYVAGLFALALEKGRKLGISDAKIERMVMNSTIDLGISGPDNGYGYGLIKLAGLGG